MDCLLLDDTKCTFKFFFFSIRKKQDQNHDKNNIKNPNNFMMLELIKPISLQISIFLR